MFCVGTAIQVKYYWVLLTIILYLVLDNTGEHRADDCVTRYVAMLKSEFNIECIYQGPRYPFINVLDLSVWDTFQSEVERQYFMKRCHVESLLSTVMITWGECILNWLIKNVFKRNEKVLCLINEAEGGNDLVESKSGEKNCDLKFDLVLNTANISKLEKGVVVNADVEEDTIDLRLENNGKEMIGFNGAIV